MSLMLFAVFARGSGFLRDQAASIRYGVSSEMDAYVVGSTAAGILVALFTAPLGAVTLPVISKIAVRSGNLTRRKFVKKLSMALFGSATILGCLGIVVLPTYLGVIAPSLYGGLRQQAWLAGTLGFISVPFAIVSPVLKAELDGEGRFWISSIQPILLNFGVIFLLFVFPRAPVSIMAAGLTVGYVIHVALQWAYVRGKSGTEESPDNDISELGEGWRLIILMSFPLVIGALASQVNILIDRFFSAGLSPGSVAALGLGDRIRQLPYGIVAASIFTAAFPNLSRLGAEARFGDYRQTLERTMWLTTLTTIPFVSLLMICSVPLIQVLFQHGQFDATSTAMTAAALIAYAPGLMGMGLSQLFSGALFALGDSKKVLWITLLANILNMMLDPLLVPHLGFTGIAYANTIAITAQVVFLWFGLPREVRPGVCIRRLVNVLGAATGAFCCLELFGMMGPKTIGLSYVVYWGGGAIASGMLYVSILIVSGEEEARQLWKRLVSMWETKVRRP